MDPVECQENDVACDEAEARASLDHQRKSVQSQRQSQHGSEEAYEHFWWDFSLLRSGANIYQSYCQKLLFWV